MAGRALGEAPRRLHKSAAGGVMPGDPPADNQRDDRPAGTCFPERRAPTSRIP